MEFRTITALILETSLDNIWNITFIKVLTEDGVETLKIPSLIKDFKYGHLMVPNNLIQVEVVKSKKNWIVREINRSYTWCKLEAFSDYIKITKIIEFISKSIKVGETSNGLKFIVDYFSKNSLKDFNSDHFQVNFLTYMGYGGELTQVV